MSRFFDIQLEKRAVAAMLHDPDTMDHGALKLSTEDFEDTNLSYMFEIMVRFYHKYYKPITREILNKWLMQNDPKRRVDIMMVFSEIDALPHDTYARYYLNELKTFTKRRKLFKMHKALTSGLNNDDDPSKIYDDLTRMIITTQSSDIVRRTTVFDEVEDRIRLYKDKRDHPEKYKGIPYGFKEIDEITGGMFPSQLYMVIGRTGAGKSRMLFNIGCNASELGKSIMYCTIEMEAAIIQQMYESRSVGIPLQNILRAQMSPTEEEAYLKFLKESGEKKIPFYIVDIPQGCTTGMIDAEVAMFEKIHGKVPDLVLIDYANLINPISKYRDRAEKYDHVFRELKEGARANRTVYYTAAQMNRESLKSKDPGTEHVAFSDAASYHCDAVFRVFADTSNEANDDIQFESIKGRYHKKFSVSLHWNRNLNLIKSWGKAEIKNRQNAAEGVDEPKDQSASRSVPTDGDSARAVANAHEDY